MPAESKKKHPPSWLTESSSKNPKLEDPRVVNQDGKERTFDIHSIH
jgi:hypothetical protein